MWALLLSLCVGGHATSIIIPGLEATTPHWNDTDGNRIEAHAAGMLRSPLDERWYWYGESQKTGDLSTHGVACYSAKDLGGPWKNEGLVVTQGDIRVAGQAGPWVVERPKVIYNEGTKKFVMWFHLDDAQYAFRHAAVLTADTAAGPFVWQHTLQPDGIPSLDMSLWKDPQDGVAYFVRSCDNAYAGISRLTPDYLNTTGIISQHERFEGMALFRLANGTYYIITSHLTGWDPNPLMLFRAAGKTLDDPQWVDMGNPTGDPFSFNSQPTFVVPMTDAQGEEYLMYMADNWVHGGPGGLIDASYIWLPIDLTGPSVVIPRLEKWDLNKPFDCVPEGASLFFMPCVSGRRDQTWVFNASTKQLMSIGLCAEASGSGSQVTMAQCSTSNKQQWVYDSHTGQVKHSADNLCLDVTWCSDHVCAGEFAELYACSHPSPNGNQEYTYDNATQSQVVVAFDSHCLSVCL